MRTTGWPARCGSRWLLPPGEPWPGGLALMVYCQGHEKPHHLSPAYAAGQFLTKLSAFSLPHPILPILTVPDATGLATGEVGAVQVGDKIELGIGDCRERRERGNVTHLCYMLGVPHPRKHGWHRGPQPWRLTLLTRNHCGNHLVANSSWQLLSPPWPPEANSGLVGVACGVVGGGVPAATPTMQPIKGKKVMLGGASFDNVRCCGSHGCPCWLTQDGTQETETTSSPCHSCAWAP